MKSLGRTRARDAWSDDNGFTLVEIMLAMFLVVAVMAALLGVVASSLKTIQQAKQRQVSAALATEALEELRALPYSKLTDPSDGVASSTLPFVVASGSTFSFAPPADLVESAAEVLVVGRQSTVIVDEASYRVMTYVTNSVKAAGSYNLTAVVEWSSNVSNGLRRSVERSTAFSPGGCLSDALHPYSGPCQAAFTGRAGSESSGATIVKLDLTDPANPVRSDPLMSLVLPALSSTVQVEQIVYGVSTLVTGGASHGTTVSGSTQTSRAVGSDPTTTIAQTDSTTVPGPSGTLLSPPAGAQFGSTANSLKGAVRAASPACVIPAAISGTTAAIATGPAAQLRPCVVTESSGSSMSALSWDGTALFTASGVSGRSAAAHIVGVSNGAGVCGVAGDGCLRSVALRSITEAAFAPSVGPKGLWYIDSYRGFVASEQGSGTLTPSIARSGTLNIWTGTGYTPVDLASVPSGEWVWGAGSPTGLPAVTGSDGRSYSGTLRLTAASSSTSGPADCKTEACVTEVSDGTLKATMLVSDVTGQYEVSINLGGAAAVASYQAAPNG